jgi:hypothetical protein
MDRHLLILFLHLGGLAAALAHVGPHCVTGIALPPVDATLFVSVVALAAAREHKGRISGVASGAEVVFPTMRFSNADQPGLAEAYRNSNSNRYQDGFPDRAYYALQCRPV